MNARTIKKRLMRRRVCSFWGRRAYLTVRLPLSAIPVEIPPAPHPRDDPHVKDPELWVQDSFGVWCREVDSEGRPVDFLDYEGDMFSESWSFSCLWSGAPPHEDEGIAARHVRKRDGGYEWFEGRYVRGQRLAGQAYEVTERRRLSDELVDAYIARRDVHERYFEPAFEPTGSVVLDALHDAAEWAKTTYPEVRGEYLYITYSLKWFYPDLKYRFCADLARVVRLAARNGVHLKVS